MVALVKIDWDKKKVADGGIVTITGYNPEAVDEKWIATASNGDVYSGAEVTSEGFQIYGLDPYKFYDAGYVCYLSNIGFIQDNWDIWEPNKKVNMNSGDIVGYKYFGFGGLDKATKGLKPLEGTKPGNASEFNVFLTPLAPWPVKLSVMLDGPFDNDTWKGKKIGEIVVPGGSAQEVTKFTIDVADAIDGLDGKHAIYLVADGKSGRPAVALNGVGFSKKGDSLVYTPAPEIKIAVNGVALNLPENPTRSTNDNGYTGYDRYDVNYTLLSGDVPEIAAVCSDPNVKIEIEQPNTPADKAVVRLDWQGKVKTYTLIPD